MVFKYIAFMRGIVNVEGRPTKHIISVRVIVESSPTVNDPLVEGGRQNSPKAKAEDDEDQEPPSHREGSVGPKIHFSLSKILEIYV